MKTIKEINEEIKQKAGALSFADEREAKKLKSQIGLLRQYRYYIESNPSEEYLKHQVKELGRKIDILRSRFSDWLFVNEGKHKNPLQAFRAEMEIPKLERQKRTIKMLLKKN